MKSPIAQERREGSTDEGSEDDGIVQVRDYNSSLIYLFRDATFQTCVGIQNVFCQPFPVQMKSYGKNQEIIFFPDIFRLFE